MIRSESNMALLVGNKIPPQFNKNKRLDDL